MKKRTAIIILASVLWILSSCGGQSADEHMEVASNESVMENESSASDESVISSNESENSEEISGDGNYFFGHVEEDIFVLTDCTSEEDTIVVPETIEGVTVGKIGESAFFESPCKHIVLPDTVTVISKEAFLYCHSLETIELGNSLQHIGILAFSGCSNLQTVSFPESLEHLELVFFMCDQLQEVYIPATATEVDGIADPGSCPDVVIVTPVGSVAESVATDMGLTVRNS